MKLHTSTKFAVAASVVVALVLLSLCKVSTTFNISASTQIVVISIGNTHRTEWHFNDASISYQWNPASEHFSGSVLALPGVPVVIERIGSGTLQLTFGPVEPNRPVVKLISGKAANKKTEFIRERLVLKYSDLGIGKDRSEPTLLLPVSGTITLGADIGDFGSDQPALLLGGSVTMLAHTLIGNRRYDAGKVSLDLADYVTLDQAGDAYGLLLVGRGADITAIFRVIAKSLSIYRYGTVGYDVYASPLTRIKNDYSIQAIWAAGLLVLGSLAKLVKDKPTK